jgi:hypothetical protein
MYIIILELSNIFPVEDIIKIIKKVLIVGFHHMDFETIIQGIN